MILADLDRELAALIAELVARGKLPPQAGRLRPGRTWRPAPDRDPSGFATPIAFQLAALARTEPAELAAELARPLSDLPWVLAAEPAGPGYLTIKVTHRALVESAVLIAMGGAPALASTILAGTTTTLRPWPDLTAAPSWRCAWQEHAHAMTGRLAQFAGASVTATFIPERRKPRASPPPAAHQPVAGAVAWYGEPSVRYALARTPPGQVDRLDSTLRPGVWGAGPVDAVRQAYVSAASAGRWAGELGLDIADPGDETAALLRTPAERVLLGLLPWLPVRVAAAAARRRPDELPVYLEEISAAWQAVQQDAPALPFGGTAAPRSPAQAGARLMLAEAVRVVLSEGLDLTGAACLD